MHNYGHKAHQCMKVMEEHKTPGKNHEPLAGHRLPPTSIKFEETGDDLRQHGDSNLGSETQTHSVMSSYTFSSLGVHMTMR